MREQVVCAEVIELRPYQAESLAECRALYRAGHRALLLQMPTGAGKTVTASTVVHGAANKQNPTWWLCHRRELVGQASRTFYDFGIPHGTVQAGHVSDPEALVQVGSIQTVTRRIEQLPEPALIIFDEAHHIGAKTWDDIFQMFPLAKILGLTATPWRLDGKGLGAWFSRMVMGPNVGQLIGEGSLSQFRIFAPAVPDLSGVGTVGGDYQRKALSKAMDKPAIVGDAIDHYKRLCPGKRAVVFAAGVGNSINVVAQFQEAGIPAEHVDGSMTNEERDAKVERFRRGQTLILSNSDLFGEGFDVPSIEAAILLRPTKSLSLYLQQVGRALRPFPGKTEAIILDHAGNSLTHGLPDDEREWSLEDRPKKARASAVTESVKQCSQCFFVYRPAPQCPNCLHRPAIQKRDIDVIDGRLEEVRREAEARKVKIEERNCHTLADWQALAMARGYKPGWALIRHQARQRRSAA